MKRMLELLDFSSSDEEEEGSVYYQYFLDDYGRISSPVPKRVVISKKQIKDIQSTIRNTFDPYDDKERLENIKRYVFKNTDVLFKFPKIDYEEDGGDGVKDVATFGYAGAVLPPVDIAAQFGNAPPPPVTGNLYTTVGDNENNKGVQLVFSDGPDAVESAAVEPNKDVDDKLKFDTTNPVTNVQNMLAPKGSTPEPTIFLRNEFHFAEDPTSHDFDVADKPFRFEYGVEPHKKQHIISSIYSKFKNPEKLSAYISNFNSINRRIPYYQISTEYIDSILKTINNKELALDKVGKLVPNTIYRALNDYKENEVSFDEKYYFFREDVPMEQHISALRDRVTLSKRSSPNLSFSFKSSETDGAVSKPKPKPPTNVFQEFFTDFINISAEEKEIMTKFHTGFGEIISKEQRYEFVLELLEVLKVLVKPNETLTALLNSQKDVNYLFDYLDIPNANENIESLNNYIAYYERLKPIVGNFDKANKLATDKKKVENTIKNLEDEIAMLQLKSEPTDKDRKDLEAKIIALDDRNNVKNGLDSEIAALDSKVLDLSNMEASLKAEQDKVEELRKQLDNSNAKITELTTADKSAELKELINENAKMKEAIIALELQLKEVATSDKAAATALQEENSKLKSQIVELVASDKTAALTALQEENSKLKFQIAELVASDKDKAATLKALQDENTNLNAQIAESDKTLTALQEENTILKSQVEADTKSHEIKAQNDKLSENEIQQLKDRVQSLTTEKDALESKLKEGLQKLETTDQDKSKSSEQIESLRDALTKEKETIKKLQDELESLKAELTTVQETSEKAKTDMESQKKEEIETIKANLKSDVDTLTAQLQEQTLEKETTQKQLESQKAELDTQIAEKAKVEAQLKKEHDQLQLERQLNKQIDVIQNELSQDNQTPEQKETKRQQLKELFNQLQEIQSSGDQAINDNESKLAETIEENAKNKVEVGELRIKLQGLETAKNAVESQLETLKTEKEQEKAQLVSKLADTEARVKDLDTKVRPQLQQAETEKTELQAQLQQANTEKANLENKLQTVAVEKEQIETKLKEAESKPDVENKLQTVTNEKAEIEARLKTTITELANEKEALKIELENACLEKMKALEDKEQSEKTVLKKQCDNKESQLQKQLEADKEAALRERETALKQLADEKDNSVKQLKDNLVLLQNKKQQDIDDFAAQKKELEAQLAFEKQQKGSPLSELKANIAPLNLTEGSAEYYMTLILEGTKLKENDLMQIQTADGASDSVALVLEDYLNKTKFLFDIFNSEIMIKLACLLSQGDLFINVIKSNNIGFDIKPVTSIFFVDVRDYQRIINVMKTKHTDLENTIDRDTAIIDKLFAPFKKEESKESDDTKKSRGEPVLFVYTLVKYLVQDFGDYITNDDLVTDMIRLLDALVGGGRSGKNMFNNIVMIYENLRKNNVNLEKNHQQLVNAMSNSFVYIKYRQDTPITNPRYQVKKIKQGPSTCYLNIRYKNIDGTYGFGTDAYTKAYSHERAVRGINSHLMKNHELVVVDDGAGGRQTGPKSRQVPPTKTQPAKPRFNDNPVAPAIVVATPDETTMKGIPENQLDDLQIPEFYYFGSFNGIYTHDDKNDFIVKDIKSQPNNIINKLLKGEDLCLVGYGQSGAGKTSTLIFKKDSKGAITDGIIIEMFKLPEFISKFESINLKATDLYTYHWQDNNDYTNYDSDNYIRKPIIIEEGSTEVNITYDREVGWVSASSNKVIGQIIDEIFNKREIEPTPNNPESSRSHLICCLTLNYRKEKGEKGNKQPRKVIICDLAGVENVFKCDDLAEIMKFDQRYDQDNKKYRGKISFDSYFRDQGPSKTIKNRDDNVFKELRDFNAEDEYVELHKSFDGGDSDASSSSSCSSLSSYSSSSSSVSSYSTGSSALDGGYTSSSDSDSSDSDSSSSSDSDSDSSDDSDSDLDEIEELINLLDGSINVEDKNKFIEDCMTTRLSEIKATSVLDLEQQIESEYTKQLKQYRERYNTVTVLNDFIQMFEGKSRINTQGGKVYDHIYNIVLPNRYNNFTYDMNLYTDILTDKWEKQLDQKKASKFIINHESIDANLFAAVLYLKLNIDFTHFLTTKGSIHKETKNADKIDFSDEIVKARNIINDDKKRKENEKVIQQLLKQLCLKHRYKAIKYNCRLRVIEGTMINHSLSEFRRDIKSIILHSLKTKNNGILPLMYEDNISTYCRNLYMMSDYYDTFDVPLEGSVTDLKFGEIFSIIKDDYKVDLSKLNFGIFTIINLSDTTDEVKTNNPPTPPYINLSKLIYKIPTQFGGMSYFKDNTKGTQREDTKQKEDIVQTLNDILTHTLTKYEFYKSNADLLKMKEAISLIDVEKNDYKQIIHDKFIAPFIKIINSNNPSTLIGSLQGTQELVRPASSIIIPSYNKYLFDKQPILFRRGDAKIEIVYGSNGSSNTITDEAFEKTLLFKGHDLF